MLIETIKQLISVAQKNNTSKGVINNLIKEYLQYYVLNYIYSNKYGKELIFTGGTCLRICYGLNRLSEDLDFDSNKKIDKKQLTQDLITYFKSSLGYKNIEANISGKNEKIYLKFPLLQELGLASNKSETKKIFVKIEIEKNPSKNFQTDLTPIAKDNLNFIIYSYDLPTLMTNKINAVINRTWQKGNSPTTFKGRDYYDLLWFLQNKIQPNYDRLKDIAGISNKQDLKKILDKKIEQINIKYLKEDLLDLFADSKYISEITKNYKFITLKYLEQNLQ